MQIFTKNPQLFLLLIYDWALWLPAAGLAKMGAMLYDRGIRIAKETWERGRERNMNEQAIVVASFGTSVPEARTGIASVEKVLAAAAPD